MMNPAPTSSNPLKQMRASFERARSILRSLSAETPQQALAMNSTDVVVSLEGVSDLLGIAKNFGWAAISSEGDVRDCKGESELPEYYMFRSTNSESLNIDLISTICSRAQASIRVFISLGRSKDGYKALSMSGSHDYTCGLWSIEGMIGQAISVVDLALQNETRRTTPTT